jgi:hypothetical protein
MKTSSLRILVFICILIGGTIQSIGQTQQLVWIVNDTPCDINYSIMCTTDDCATIPGAGSGTLGSSAIDSIGCGSDFVGLRFWFPDGNNTIHYITFFDELDNACAGIEACNEIYPWQHQGDIETYYCLGENGRVRADFFSEFNRCTIWFQHDN